MGLFAIHPPEHVTVADIAAAADMTAAAVYYHFPSKERVLLEGLQQFADTYLVAVRDLAAHGADDAWPGELVTELFAWLDTHRTAATVYFAHSAGVDASIEALRRETRIGQVTALARIARQHTPGSLSTVEAEVVATALVSLLETTGSSWLTHDDVFLGLGPRRFVAEAAALAQRLVFGSTPANAPSVRSR